MTSSAGNGLTANGLLPRRAFMARSAAGLTLLSASSAIAGGRDNSGQIARHPGAPMSEYGQPSQHAATIVRQRIRSAPGTTGSGASATPLQNLRGTLTPAGLHFERHHSGVPSLNPATHKLAIHGAVKKPLSFSLATLHRYPMISRTLFLECSGNSAALLTANPLPWNCGDIHGLVSCSEWTGVPLKWLLDEAEVAEQARWVIAEGADAGRMNRSIPLSKCLNDAMVALYQNGEPLRPENGYPMRLFLPGFEGNMSIKWLHRLEVTEHPAMSREETSKYTELLPNGRANGFSFGMDVKSVITSPSPNQTLNSRGVYQISGLAWSGKGNLKRVEVSADAGKSWVDADFSKPPEPLALARFQAAWNWQGQPAVLLSRATDSNGNQQPTRRQWLDKNGAVGFYHYNAQQAWRVSASGEIENTYVS